MEIPCLALIDRSTATLYYARSLACRLHQQRDENPVRFLPLNAGFMFALRSFITIFLPRNVVGNEV